MAVAKSGFEAKDERKSSWARIESWKDSSWILGTSRGKSERIKPAFFRSQVVIFREQVKERGGKVSWKSGK